MEEPLRPSGDGADLAAVVALFFGSNAPFAGVVALCSARALSCACFVSSLLIAEMPVAPAEGTHRTALLACRLVLNAKVP